MPRPRRYDPERRERLVAAALRVVRRDGIAGLSHRAVAAEADVPLGSTTYHFSSLDELLVAALRRVDAGFAERLRSGAVRAGDDLAGDLARLLGERLGAGRSQAELEYELYLAALRRPALRPVAAAWAEEATAALAPRAGRAAARDLVALADGIVLRALLTGAPYDEAHAREMIARILHEGPKTQAGGSSDAPARPPGT
ncbi:TetR/AcrR family transcriptional regulator [Streptomyces roseolus]|uniref:TetR/AcrR family transcriptional regulator n=1 Tax=Streptomyces roseolus TaxID=67358 RepID=UPI001679FAD8|nr:TetR family transcriptional regulator [Streptomyces roseolus]GGR47593.1 ebrA repressor [Streptomyces roseolus]